MAKRSKILKSQRLLKARAKYWEKVRKTGVRKRNRVSTRGVNRCSITGRPRAYIRYFGLSRLTFRELAAKGELPGVVKSNN